MHFSWVEMSLRIWSNVNRRSYVSFRFSTYVNNTGVDQALKNQTTQSNELLKVASLVLHGNMVKSNVCNKQNRKQKQKSQTLSKTTK